MILLGLVVLGTPSVLDALACVVPGSVLHHDVMSTIKTVVQGLLERHLLLCWKDEKSIESWRVVKHLCVSSGTDCPQQWDQQEEEEEEMSLFP